MATDLSETIAAEAAAPVSSTADGQSATARPLADLITADRYLAAKAAMASRRKGVQFGKLIPPGPICDDGTAIIGTPFGGGIHG